MKHKYLIFALIFALLNAGAVFLIFGFQRYGDSVGLLNTIRGFSGGSELEAYPWILRPLGPFLAMPLEFLGKGAGLIVQNIVFYLFSSFLIFKIADLIYHNKRQALLASFFFVTSVSVIESGLAYLTDMGAWFFYLLSIFLTLLYFKGHDMAIHSVLPTRLFAPRQARGSDSPHPNPFVHSHIMPLNDKLIILNGFISGLGFLMKENGALGALFFGLMILFSGDFSIKEKVLKIARFTVFFLIPVALLQILTFKYFQFTSWDWYLSNQPGLMLNQEGFLLVSFRWLGQIFKVLGILWVFFFIGLWLELRGKNRQRIKIYLALIPSSLSFFLWSVEAAGRSAFIFAPFGMLLATYGLSFMAQKMGKKTGIFTITLLIAVVLFINYYFSWLNSRVLFIDRIVEFFGII